MIALFSFFLGITSVLAYQKFQPTRTVPVGQSLIVSPEPAADPIANWKTYTNNSIGYLIKYPESVEVKADSPQDISITRKGVPLGGQEGKVPLGGMTIYGRGNEGLEKGNDLGEQASIKMTINGFRALGQYSLPGIDYQNDIFITDLINQRTVRVSINTYYDKGYEEETFALFIQILSTFKFTDTNEVVCQTSSDCPAGYFCNTFDQTCNQELPD